MSPSRAQGASTPLGCKLARTKQMSKQPPASIRRTAIQANESSLHVAVRIISTTTTAMRHSVGIGSGNASIRSMLFRTWKTAQQRNCQFHTSRLQMMLPMPVRATWARCTWPSWTQFKRLRLVQTTPTLEMLRVTCSKSKDVIVVRSAEHFPGKFSRRQLLTRFETKQPVVFLRSAPTQILPSSGSRGSVISRQN